jgi:CRISPR type IV-associated protein Csf3
MSDNFRPFTLLIKIGTPLVVPSHSIHLDALLWWCVGAHYDPQTADACHEHLRKILMFDTSGVYQASSMVMIATPEQGVSLMDVTRADRLTPEKLSTSGGVNITKKRLVVVGGPTKKRLTNYPAHTTPYVAFHAVGDAVRCKQLLLSYLPGIGTDSRTASNGDILDIQILNTEHENAWCEDLNGNPARNLPAAFAKEKGMELVTEFVKLKPSYKTNPSFAGVSSERIKIQSIYEIFGDE